MMPNQKQPSLWSFQGCLLGILSLLAILGSIGAGSVLEEKLQPVNTFEKLLKVVIVDFFFTVAAVFILALLFMAFKPRWLDRLLQTTIRKFFLVFGVMVVGFLIVGFFIFFVEGRR